MRNRIGRDEQFKPKNPFDQLRVDVLNPLSYAVGLGDGLSDMIQHRQQETTSACRWVEDERVFIGKTVGSVQFRSEEAVHRSHDVGDNLWRCVVDPAIDAPLRIVFGEESLVEVDNRIFEMIFGGKRRAEHLCRDVLEERRNIVQNVGDVRLQCPGEAT